MVHITFLVALLATNVFCIIPNHFHFREKLNKAARPTNSDIGVTSAIFEQKLDHSGNSNTTFNQRYFYSEHFTLNKKTAFLYVSHNGDFEAGVLRDERNAIVKTARRFGATTFSLEHRYYGDSKPGFDTYNGQDLRYLNSFQAIQDIIAFIKYANVQFSMDPDVRWVLWGAGYGGVIAAEARKWDPVTISGVIASSAPIDRIDDFYAYNDKVAEAILQEGGASCFDRVKQGFSDIRQLMTTLEGRGKISDVFQLNFTNAELTENDMQMFYLSIIAPFQQIVQFNNDFNLSISDMCTIIDKSTWTNVQVVYQAYVYLSTTLTGAVKPLVTSYKQIVADLGNSSAISSYSKQNTFFLITQFLVDQRMWQWQVCTEFGWFYTTNNNENGLFGSVVPTSLFINQCIDVFPDANLTASSIRDRAKFPDEQSSYQGTNVVFTNGEMDPWSVLGKTDSGDVSVVAYTIPKTSWAADFFPGDNSSEFIQQAHSIMAENINVWISGPQNLKTSAKATTSWTRPQWNGFSKNQTSGTFKAESRFSKLSNDALSKRTSTKYRFGRKFFGVLPALTSPVGDSYPVGFEQGTFRQRFDHFNNSDPRFFQQKYFKNSQWAQSEGPNFLVIGGEQSGIYASQVTGEGPVIKLAKKYGATIYVIEHRFYGESLVGNNSELHLLTSLQMLYDLAEFITANDLKTGTSNPWITFGGSYPGALSAWMREVFPDLVVGAIASSAPVFAKTDFYEFHMVVERAIRDYSMECAENIKHGFENIRQLLLTKEGRSKLNEIFNLNPPFDDNFSEIDQHYFIFLIKEYFEYAVQYSKDVSSLSIPKMCKRMTNFSNTPLQNIRDFSEANWNFWNHDHTVFRVNRSYENYVKKMKDTSTHGPEDNVMFLWTWQTCNEFGYFATLDSGNNLFGVTLPVSFYIQMCQDIYNIQLDRKTVDGIVKETNYKYGGRSSFRGTNVVFINGDIDPWHALSLYNSTDTSVVSYLIKGSSHCVDMHPERETDVPGLKIARKLVDRNIGIWIGRGNSTTDPTEQTPEVTTTSSSAANLSISIITCLIAFIL